MKKTQVKGQVYELPEREIEVEKLTKKGLSLTAKIKEMQEQLEPIKARLTEIAQERRGETGTVKLTGVSGAATVTFRESWEAAGDVSEVSPLLGDLFGRFFKPVTTYKTNPALKKFLSGVDDCGLSDPESVRASVMMHVTRKTVKPYIQFVPVNDPE